MQKTTTSLNKTDELKPVSKCKANVEMQPTDETLKKILQFAATYRAERIGKNQYIEMCLN